MTGTGTQADPYICETWEELLSVTTAASVYAEISDNAEKIVDLNETIPQGYSESIELSGHIDFKGLIIKNFRSYARRAIYIQARHTGNSWKNVTFDNFYQQYSGSDSKDYAFIGTDTGESKILMQNCNFYGKLNYNHSNSSGKVCAFYSSNYKVLTFDQCAFTVEISCNNHAVDVFRMNYIKDSHVKINVNALSANIVTVENLSGKSRYIFNSFVEGKVTVSDTTTNIYCGDGYSGFNYFSLQTNVALAYGGYGVSVFNSDLSPDTVGHDTFAGCTSEQLKNANYLCSVGFPCYRGDEEWT